MAARFSRPGQFPRPTPRPRDACRSDHDTASPIARPSPAPTSTSIQKCTPRYTRENAITAASASTGQRIRGASSASAPATANAVIACPDGNEGEPGTTTSASKSIAAGGRLRSKSALSSALSPDAMRKLIVAASATSGTARRQRRSAHQPAPTSSGPFTHHAEASVRIAVAGAQRSSLVARIAS